MQPSGSIVAWPGPFCNARVREMALTLDARSTFPSHGATSHTVSRILSGWEQRGILESHRLRIGILQPAAVRAIADDLLQTAPLSD